MNMKLSFAIPAYNEEANIGACLTSILQELESKSWDVEIIVINNASTDRTAEIARSFPNIRVIDEPMKGLVRAR
jgi:glycosyltransferase involved in cell wall biosynthesis